MASASAYVYKVCTDADWAACQRDGRLPWAPVDARDGFVHLSAVHQVAQTAAKHFHGRADLVVLEVDPERLPADALRWEVSRGGDRFPHLYGDLSCAAVLRATAVPLDPEGVPIVPLGASCARTPDAEPG